MKPNFTQLTAQDGGYSPSVIVISFTNNVTRIVKYIEPVSFVQISLLYDTNQTKIFSQLGNAIFVYYSFRIKVTFQLTIFLILKY